MYTKKLSSNLSTIPKFKKKFLFNIKKFVVNLGVNPKKNKFGFLILIFRLIKPT